MEADTRMVQRRHADELSLAAAGDAVAGSPRRELLVITPEAFSLAG